MDKREPVWVTGLWRGGIFAAVVVATIVLSVHGVHFEGGTTLALLGGLMGAVFAAGGLVIGTVSVVTLLHLDERIQSKLDRANSNMQPKIERQANAQIEAHKCAPVTQHIPTSYGDF